MACPPTDKSRKSYGATGSSVDWIILTASALGLAVVLTASICAGDTGLVAQLGGYVTGTAAF